MPLDDEQKQKVQTYFDKRFKCHACGSIQWEASLAYLPAEEAIAGRAITALKTNPILVVGCDSCGFAHFYSAKKLGIVS